jgi:hypothetical protein
MLENFPDIFSRGGSKPQKYLPADMTIRAGRVVDSA